MRQVNCPWIVTAWQLLVISLKTKSASALLVGTVTMVVLCGR